VFITLVELWLTLYLESFILLTGIRTECEAIEQDFFLGISLRKNELL